MNNPLPLFLSKLTSSHFALGLICCAITGAGVSYHFTVENRFSLLETRQEQTSTTLVEIQNQQEENAAARSDDFTKLSKQVDDLKQSIIPIAIATKEQGQSLVDIRKQMSGIETNYATQLEKIQKEDELVLASNTAIASDDPSKSNNTVIEDPAESGAVRALPVLPMTPTAPLPVGPKQATMSDSNETPLPVVPHALPITDNSDAQANSTNLPNYNLPQP